MMNLKKDSKTTKRNIIRNFAIYIVVIVVVLVVVTSLFDIKNKLKSNQIFNIFIASNTQNENEFATLIKNQNDSIKEVNIYSCSIDDTYFSVLFSLHGQLEADLIVLPKSILDEKMMAGFCELDDDLKSSSIVYENRGLLVHDNNYSNEILDNYCTFNEEQYYLFISLNSCHFGKDDYFAKDVIKNIIYG